ncbi:MAG TPA: ATP-binding cassette domain-containing protein [Trebonia sp.]
MWLTARARSGTLPYTLGLVVLLGIFGAARLQPAWHSLIIVSMCWAVAAIGLDLVSGYLGQPSFGNAAFVGVGAYTMVLVRTKLGLGWVGGLIGMVIVVGLLATVVGLAVIRLKHFSSVLVTFFFAYVVYVLATGTALAGLNNDGNGYQVDPISIGGHVLDGQWSIYAITLVVLLIVALVTNNYANSRSGRALRLIKENETVATAMSVPVGRVKLTAFVYSAIVAGFAGVLLAFAIGYISPDLMTTSQSVILFAMAALGGLGSVAGPILGATVFTLLPQVLQRSGNSGDIYFALIFLLAVMFLPEGLFGVLEAGLRQLTRVIRRDRPAPAAPDAAEAPPEPAGPPERRPATGDPLLVVADVRLEFGGVIALDDVDLVVHPGTVHALIGPNGAGKTSLLNCLTGLEPHYRGEITLGGQPLRGLGGAAVRRLGVSRTFQNPSLVGDLTALENVQLGLYASHRWSLWRDLLGSAVTRHREASVADAAGSALTLVGLDPARWGVLAADLTLGEQKVVDVARAVADRSRLVVLDEPTAGLESEDIDRLAVAITNLRADTELTVIVVAHSIGFVNQVSDMVTVMHEGRTFRTGTPEDIAASREVVDVFMGREDWGLAGSVGPTGVGGGTE